MNVDVKSHVLRAIASDLRFDGRKKEDYREVSIEMGVSGTAEGSARVTIGDTVVIAGVKLGMEKPYPDTPDQGNLMVGVEMLPLSHEDFEPGPPSIESIEMARVVDRCVRESHAIDVKDLCVTPGEQVWSVMCDVCTINNAGNLFDASSLAVAAALYDARLPEVEDGVVNYKKKTDKKLPLKCLPIAVTAWKVGDQIILDPLVVEEKASDARLTIGSIDDGKVCALQKGGSGTLSNEDVATMFDLSLAKGKDLRTALSKVIKK